MAGELTLVAFDDADDDGGTLYVLYDGPNNPILDCPVPQPLEAYAEAEGRYIARSSTPPIPSLHQLGFSAVYGV